MKSKIYLYLFLFTALICLYLLVSGNKMQNQLGERNVKLEEKVEATQKDLTVALHSNMERQTTDREPSEYFELQTKQIDATLTRVTKMKE